MGRILFATALTIITGAATTHAGPCKGLGVQCPTTASCCRGLLCVNSNPPGKRPKGVCLSPTTTSTSTSTVTTTFTTTITTTTTSTTLEADLSLGKQASPTTVFGNPGSVTFTLTLHNAGPGTATGVEVTDGLPTEFVFNSATPATDYNSATHVWSVGTLASNGDATLEISTEVNSCENTGSTHTNTAEVTKADQTDPDSTPDNDNSGEDDQAIASVVFGCD